MDAVEDAKDRGRALIGIGVFIFGRGPEVSEEA
jgi:hypothetical protein